MQLGVWNAGPEAFRLLADVPTSSGHRITTIAGDGTWTTQLGHAHPDARQVSSWEEMLHDPQLDAVLVGSEDDAGDREDGLRKLVQAGGCIILEHPVGDPLFALELEMIRTDSDALIITYLPDTLDLPTFDARRSGNAAPEVQDSATSFRFWRPPVDAMRELVWDRNEMSESGTDVVTGQLARDLLWMRLWLGPFAEISAMTPAGNLGNSLSLHAKTVDGRLVRWSTTPNKARTAELTVYGQTGIAHHTLTLSQHEEQTPWRPDDESLVDSSAPHDGAPLLSDWHKAMEQKKPPWPWEVTCQSLLMLDGVTHSLERGRTVSLRNEPVTEHDTFRGMMAAVGCSLVLVCPIILFLIALVEGVGIPMRQFTIWRSWPILLLIPLIAFLGLQGLQLVYRYGDVGENSDG